jgi:oligosaccharyltransferase complex subunit delta (ribophorin II)
LYVTGLCAAEILAYDVLQSQKDLPVQLLAAGRPLDATLLLGSFGSSAASAVDAFRVEVELDTNAPTPKVEEPLRYGKRPEIHHIFRADPKNPPKVVSLAFALAVLATIPAVFIGVSAQSFNALQAKDVLLTS